MDFKCKPCFGATRQCGCQADASLCCCKAALLRALIDLDLRLLRTALHHPTTSLLKLPSAWTQGMKRGSNAGGERMSRLLYVVLISLSCVLLLQLSGWSRTLEHTTPSSSQTPGSRPVHLQLPLQSNASITPSAAGAKEGASVLQAGAASVQSAAGSATAWGSPPFR